MFRPINHVLIYKGHVQNSLLGPYPENIRKRIEMFHLLNEYRVNRPQWNITAVSGEDLTSVLQDHPTEETLLVIPAGQSTHLDRVFSRDQTSFLKKWFESGGRGYFNCGSAYWVSEKRIYSDLCVEQPTQQSTFIKASQLPLFQGVSEGPLCPYPGKEYKVGFFSDAVSVTDGSNKCTIFLSGGGSFFPRETGQKVRVLVRYLPSELKRLSRNRDYSAWKNAVILVSVGKGAALLSMFHPYYGPQDIDVDRYNKELPFSGTNWEEVHSRLSPLDVRMRFVLNAMLGPLENPSFE